jgi:hypothetical protein
MILFLQRQRLQVVEGPPAPRLLTARTAHRTPLIPGLLLTMARQRPMEMTITDCCKILGKHLLLPVTGK